jgi:hypothetical protein
MKIKMDTPYFPAVAGSVTSEDGQTSMLHVKGSTGGDSARWKDDNRSHDTWSG